MKIIFAQGNPEPKYANTRHNTGFFVLNALADELNVKWANKTKLHADIAEVIIANEKVLLVKPITFYNETGLSLRQIIDFYKIASNEDLLVLHDDLALPFGTIRVRERGSDAGNNGIKSINSHLEHGYSRIRIGICNELRDKMDDADFVLSKFSSIELKQLKENVTPQVIKLINQFCENSLKQTSYNTLEK